MTERIALTFDDGPSVWTEPILDILAAHEARATFFVIGSLAEQRPDVVRRIAAEGHEVGNHSWSHPWLARDCADERVDEELRRTNEVLTAIVGSPPRRFRAPHYDVDRRVEAIAARLGLAHTRGDVAPADWHERSTPAFIATMVLQQVNPGAVVGLHDGVPPESGPVSRQPTVDAVATILPRLRERELDCVTASVLLGSGTFSA
jgi:peptidoglycan-N-acetylglucosamine deacetylase